MIQYNQICPICGKPFWVTGTQWAYKKTVYSGSRYDKIVYYCSWKCLRIDEKQDQGKHYDGATMRYTMRKQTKGKVKK